MGIVAPILGINLSAAPTDDIDADHPLGLTVQGSDGRTWVYVKADGTGFAADAVCTVDASTFIAAEAEGGTYTAASDFDPDQYGWIPRTGLKT